uniref:CAZy families GH26 protein n=1 Tax=uncultured Rhodothermus sp. TaxID=246141 RepID=A0A060C824_9BACT|nr:CAZy families GH26 protein [uncultured Rhodothermus sp.]
MDDYIDVGREDNSGSPEQVFQGFVQSLEELSTIALRHGKLAAMTEVGTPNALAGVERHPWTGFLDRGADANDLTRRVLWYLTWTNSWHDEPNIYGTPLSGDSTGPDFRDMREKGFIHFLDRMPRIQ